MFTQACSVPKLTPLCLCACLLQNKKEIEDKAALYNPNEDPMIEVGQQQQQRRQ